MKGELGMLRGGKSRNMRVWESETKKEAEGKSKKSIGKTGLGMKGICVKNVGKIATVNGIGGNAWALDKEAEVGRLGLGEKK